MKTLKNFVNSLGIFKENESLKVWILEQCKENLVNATLAGTVTKIGSANGHPVYIWNEAFGSHKYREASSWEIAPGQQKVWRVRNVPFEGWSTLFTDDGIVFRIYDGFVAGFWGWDDCVSWEKRFVITVGAPAHLWQDPSKDGQYLCRPLSTAELDTAYRANELTNEQKRQILRKILNACVESVKRKDVELLCSPYCLKQYKVKKIALGNKTIYKPDDSGEVTVYKIALTAKREPDYDLYFISADIDSDGHIFKINECTEKEWRGKTKNETGCTGVCKYGALLGIQDNKACKFTKGRDCLCWFPLSESEITEALCEFKGDFRTGLFKLPDTHRTLGFYR